MLAQIAFDPENEHILYGVGSTRGSLFPNKTHGGGSSDAVVFKLNATSGELLDGVQFGGGTDDFGTGLVFDSSSGVVFASISTKRQIGEYSLSNFHLYKLTKSLEMLGDVLLRSFSREVTTGFAAHPTLKNTLLACGESRLDSRNGFDMFLKRVVTEFDASNISSVEMDIDEVKENEYTRRYGSRDGKHDYASTMKILRGGGVVLGGYSEGSFSEQNSNSLSGVLALIDARTGQLVDTRQMKGRVEGGWTDIVAMEMSMDEEWILYTGATIEGNGSKHIHIGMHGTSADWRRVFGADASSTPTPSVSSVVGGKGVGAMKDELSQGAMIGIGMGCAVVVVAAVVAIVWWGCIMRKRRTVAMYEYDRGRMEDATTTSTGAKKGRLRRTEATVVRQGENCGGLV